MKAVIIFVLIVLASLQLSAEESKPNFILIMVDEMGY